MGRRKDAREAVKEAQKERDVLTDRLAEVNKKVDATVNTLIREYEEANGLRP